MMRFIENREDSSLHVPGLFAAVIRHVQEIEIYGRCVRGNFAFHARALTRMAFPDDARRKETRVRSPSEDCLPTIR